MAIKNIIELMAAEDYLETLSRESIDTRVDNPNVLDIADNFSERSALESQIAGFKDKQKVH